MALLLLKGADPWVKVNVNNKSSLNIKTFVSVINDNYSLFTCSGAFSKEQTCSCYMHKRRDAELENVEATELQGEDGEGAVRC